LPAGSVANQEIEDPRPNTFNRLLGYSKVCKKASQHVVLAVLYSFSESAGRTGEDYRALISTYGDARHAKYIIVDDAIL